MAIINCPECEKGISDSAKACPHCGFPVLEKEQDAPSPQQVEVVKVALEKPKNLKKTIIGVAIAAIVVVAVIVGVLASNASRTAAARKEYIENLNSFNAKILAGAVIAESQCNLTKSVWYNTIHKESDSKTNKYTIKASAYSESSSYYKDKDFNDDFNISLAYLYADDSTVKIISALKENRDEVAELFTMLTAPPEDLSSCYSVVEDLYSAYYNLTGMAINPSGSLNTFSEDFREYDKLTVELFEKLGKLIPAE